MSHCFSLRVYYEDTDFGGIVYYANYLKFIERARTEWVREMGVDQVRLKEDESVVFAVRQLEADYLRPARFDDQLEVETVLEQLTGARMIVRQVVRRGGEDLFVATVTIVAITESGAVTRLPAGLRRNLH